MRFIKFLPPVLLGGSVWVLMLPAFSGSPYSLTYAAVAWGMAVMAAAIYATMLDFSRDTHAQHSRSAVSDGAEKSHG